LVYFEISADKPCGIDAEKEKIVERSKKTRMVHSLFKIIYFPLIIHDNGKTFKRI
jgi:hypothetical protein